MIGGRERPVVSASLGNHFAILVDDISAWERQLVATSTRYEPLKTRQEGACQIFAPDPDEHYVELCTAPGVATAQEK